MYKNNLLPFLFSILIAITGTVHAENSQDFGDYVVHFNALNTNHLPPTVTREYGRSVPVFVVIDHFQRGVEVGYAYDAQNRAKDPPGRCAYPL